MLFGQNPQPRTTPTWQEPVWNGLKIYSVRMTVVQPVGSEPLKPYAEKVTTKKDFKSRKAAHVWTGVEPRMSYSPVQLLP